MSNAEDEIRSALRMLEPRIADFEARWRAATAGCAPGDPMLQSLAEHLQLLREERLRLHAHLRQLSAG